MLQLLVGLAQAADIHLDLTSEDGIAEQAQWKSSETFTRRFGPVETKKGGSAVYAITVSPSVFDPLENAYRVELSTCIEWSRKGKSDRTCQRDEILAPPEANGPTVRSWSVKGSDKFEWTAKLWFTGESPRPGVGPTAPTESAEDADDAG